MRILQIGKFYPIRGGVERVMRDLTEGLSERGIICDMLCAALATDKLDEKDKTRAKRKGDVTIIKLNRCGRIIVVGAVAKKAGTMLSPAMIKYLREHKDRYDIIHIHHPDPMAALALRLSGYNGRVILHWHSDIVAQKVLLPLYRPLQNWLIRRAERIVGTTPVYIKESPHLRKAQDKCVCVPIGIKPLNVYPGQGAALRRAFYAKYLIYSVGRLVPYKGYDMLIEAMNYLPEEYELFIVGEGPLKKKLQKQIDDAGQFQRITLSGRLEEEGEFLDLYDACDVFALPSVMKTEAFGIVQLEAFSCGKPVVSTRIPGSGVDWVNEDGVSGLTVPPRNPQALADAIRGICEGEKPWQEYSCGARMRFETLFTRERLIENIIKIYEHED